MTDIGVLAQRINSQNFKVYLDTGTDEEYKFLQNASLNMSHSEFREPTTNGGLIYYSGLSDNTLSGTLLLTTDLITGSTVGDLDSWMTVNAYMEYPIQALKITLTDASGTTSSYSFSQAKLASCVIYKGQEGAVKADVTFVLFTNPSEYT